MSRNELNRLAEIERERYLDKVANDMFEGAKAYLITRHGIGALRRRLIADALHLAEFDKDA